MPLATPRWTQSETNPREFLLVKGITSFKVGRRTSPEVIETIKQLPYDYLELGNRAADEQEDRRRAQAEVERLTTELAALQSRLAVPDEKRANVILTLSEDLEKSLQWMGRFMHALGLQEGGPLYEECAALMRKYKLHPPTPAHSWEDLHEPFSRSVLAPGTSPLPNDDRIYKVSYNDEEGKLNFNYPEKPSTDIELEASEDELDPPEESREWLQ